MKHFTLFMKFCLVFLLGSIIQVQAQTEYITNGTFETGDFTGWTVLDTGSGAWAINNGTYVAISGFGPNAPISGSYDVITDQGGPSYQMISQPFVVPGNISSAILSWDDRINNPGGVYQDPNQEFRVDLLDSAGNIIDSIFSTNPGDSAVQLGPNNRWYDLTTLMQGLTGQTVSVRFQERDNLFFFNVVLDNISFLINATTCTNPITANIQASGLKSFWGTQDPNTFYFGVGQWKRMRVNHSGGVGPFTYSWSVTGPGTLVNATSKSAYLFDPTGPVTVSVTIDDLGSGCQTTEDINIAWDDQYFCGTVSPRTWYLKVCDNGTSSCVPWGTAKVMIQNGAVLGDCAQPTKMATSITASIYPNPTSNSATLEYQAEKEGRGTVMVMDINGRLLKQAEVIVNTGIQYQNIDLNGMPSGLYFVRLSTDNDVFTEKLQLIK